MRYLSSLEFGGCQAGCQNGQEVDQDKTSQRESHVDLGWKDCCARGVQRAEFG